MDTNSKSRDELLNEINKLKQENSLLQTKLNDLDKIPYPDNYNFLKKITEITSTIFIIYQDDKIVYFNNAAIELLGYSEDDFFQAKFSGFIHPDFQKIEKANRQLLINGEKESVNCELKIIKKKKTTQKVGLILHANGLYGKTSQLLLVWLMILPKEKTLKKNLLNSNCVLSVLLEPFL